MRVFQYNPAETSFCLYLVRLVFALRYKTIQECRIMFRFLLAVGLATPSSSPRKRLALKPFSLRFFLTIRKRGQSMRANCRTTVAPRRDVPCLDKMRHTFQSGESVSLTRSSTVKERRMLKLKTSKMSGNFLGPQIIK